MQQAEENAANALSKLNLGGFVTIDNEGQNQMFHGNDNNKMPSQESATLDDPSIAQKLEESGKQDDLEDDEMKASADSGEFDKQLNT